MSTTMSTTSNFMGVVIDPVNGPDNPKIKKALNSSGTLLDTSLLKLQSLNLISCARRAHDVVMAEGHQRYGYV